MLASALPLAEAEVLRAEGKERVRDNGLGLLPRGVEAPDTGGVRSTGSAVALEPLHSLPFSLPFLDITPLSNTSSELEDPSPRLSFEFDFDLAFNAAANTAALEGCKHELDVFGLGVGDCLGDTPGDDLGEALGETLGEEGPDDGDLEPEGERRGEGSGKSSFSSSSAMGEDLRLGISGSGLSPWRSDSSERKESPE